MRLLAAGQRPISNVVDASNYVMVELGKPIHTFDAAAVHDGRIIVRRATAGERVRDARPRRARARPRDAGHRRRQPGRSGSPGSWAAPSSEVGDGTTDVVVESAIFDPISIRRTAFRYALRSEASLRFEKGQECRLARLGADRTARLIAEWAGGEVAPGAVDTAPGRAAAGTRRVPAGAGQPAARHRPRRPTSSVPCWPASGSRPPRLRRRRAIRVAAGTQAARRRRRATAEVIEATVPTWRRDLAVEADIAEEIIRVRGYELGARRRCPTRRCRRTATIRSPSATPSARRSSAPA